MRQIRNSFFVIFFLIDIMGGVSVKGQTYHFLKYGVENGLQNKFVYTINEDTDGFLWIGTGTELVRFDGKIFRKGFLPDSLQQSFVTSSLKDRQGDLWFGFNDGYVGYYHKRKFTFYDVHRFSESRIYGLVQDPFGNILVASQNGGVFRITPHDEKPIHALNLKEVHQISALAVSGSYLLVGTFDGLYVYHLTPKNKPPELVEKVSGISRVQTIFTERQDALIGTMDAGVYRIHLKDKLSLENMGDQWGLGGMNITDILRDTRGDYWFATFGHGVVRMHHDKTGFIREDYNDSTGLGALNIQCIFEDFEKNIWIGTYGRGLILFPDDALLLYHFKDHVPGENITAITVYDGKVVLAGGKGIVIEGLQMQGKRKILTKSNGLPESVIEALYVDTDHTLWIGTRDAGIYTCKENEQRVHPVFQSGNKLENTIHSITGEGKFIWAGTASGVLLFDSDGHRIRKFSTYEGLPYNNINQVYADKKQGMIWLATMSDGLYAIGSDDSIYRKYKFPVLVARLQMKSFTVDPSGGYWVGTYGNGVFNITKDTILNYTENSGLISNYCYSLVVDSTGNIWVGHSSGISRIYPDKKNVRAYARKQGIVAECNLNAAVTDPQGKVWIGTSNGIIRFDPIREKTDTIPPKTKILSLTFSDKKIPVKKKIVMPFGRYRVRIDFLGISYRDPQEVMYQYKLENYDDDWSALTNNTYAYYGRLEDGKYTFLLRAYNSAGYSTREPVRISIIIKHPFWKTWWFILFSILALIVAVYIIIKVREQNHIRKEEFLEKELEKRSKEVLEKNAELELKNKEITDSINYARRIQSSILPPTQKLKDVFPESFIFYQPRDIVSGDFYWWGYVDTDRFLVVCADSTGHGVPGAFMSMIGSTLIKDLTQQGRYETPSQLLEFLDREITSSLNQNLESGKSDDGMDIIILEVNIQNNHIKFASAMRPVILFMDNVLYTLRGNRSGVGGEIISDEKKVFNDQEYDLKKGDIIYMFSDGYPDQFGGPRGKKFKMGPLRNLLEEIHERSMDEQYELVKRTFEEWKGNTMQIDDVLFMGLRF